MDLIAVSDSVNVSKLYAALNRSPELLGVLPEFTALRPQVRPVVFDRLDSTNQQAWQLIDQGAGAGTVIIARQQYRGRGQWGRQWNSPLGGLYLSMVLEPTLSVGEATLLTLASGWGIATSLENLGLSLQLKWPNDFVREGKKFGGILTETRLGTPASDLHGQLTYIHTAVIGVGLNWLNPLPENAGSLRELLPDSPPAGLKTLEDLAAIAVNGILQGYHHWQCQGTAPLLAAYQQKLSCLGQTVSVGQHIGRISGLSPSGGLLCCFDEAGVQWTEVLAPGEIQLGYNKRGLP